MRYLLLAVMVGAGLSYGQGSRLDSLITSSAQQVQHYKMMPLIPPAQLFANRDSIVPAPTHLSGLHLNQPSMYEQVQFAGMDKRIRELEINVTKISVILENMQKVNEKHSDRFDTVMKFIEVLITAIAGVATALIGVYFKKKKA